MSSAEPKPKYQPPLDVVNSYVDLKWPVIPLCSCSHKHGEGEKHLSGCSFPGKVPLLIGWQKRGVPTDIEVAKWRKTWPWANIGLLMGNPSGLVGVDIDGDAGERLLAEWSKGDLPDTLEFRRGKNSRRLLYRIPEGVTLKKFSKADRGKEHEELALLGQGQQTVVPPSIHAGGDVYEWAPGRDPWTFGEAAIAPGWIISRMAKERQTPVSKTKGAGGGGLDMLAAKCERFAREREDQRKDGLDYDTWFKWVALLIAAGLPDDALTFSRESKKHDGKSEQIIKRRVEDPEEQKKGPTRCITLGCKFEQVKKCFKEPHINDDGETINSPAAFLKKLADIGGRPEINTSSASSGDLPLITGKAIDALKAANRKNMRLFIRDGLARLEKNGLGGLTAVPLTEHGMRGELARAAYWFKITESGEKATPPPMHVVRDVMSLPGGTLPFPELARITHIPTFAPDGTLETAPGYHAASMTYYEPVKGLIIPEVPQRPEQRHVERARALILDELLADFPFSGQADRAHAVALLLLPFCRAMITTPTPMHLIESSTPGTGKGLLASVLLGVATGWPVSMGPLSRDDEEIRKTITARLLGAPEVVLFDNVSYLGGGHLAAALTGNTWNDRPLGESKMPAMFIRCVWCSTGNNVALGGDIPRRVIRIRITPKEEMPWLREGFKHELPPWAEEHRGELVWAALVLIKAWLAAGRPTEGIKTLGSYESWSKVIGGILKHAGIPGFRKDSMEFYETADREGAVWREFVGRWREKFGYSEAGTAELFPLALDTEGFDLGKGGSDRAQRTIFGKRLAKQKDRIYSGCKIERAKVAHQATMWRLVSVKEGGKDPAEENFPQVQQQAIAIKPEEPAPYPEFPAGSKAMDEEPLPCRICGGTRLWKNPAGRWRCEKCYPPVGPEVVLEWVDVK